MQDSWLAARWCACGLFVSLVMAGICRGQNYVHIETDLARAARERIERALSQPGSISCVDKPLSALVDDLSQQMGINMVLAKTPLEEAAIPVDTPITARVSGVSYRAILRLILKEQKLNWVIRDEVLLVTTQDDADQWLETRLYPVLDLVALEGISSREAVQGEADYDTLIDTIATTVEPDSWDEVGGAGTVADFPNAGALVIMQTQEIHAEVEKVLLSLRRVKEMQGIPSIPITAAASRVLVTRGSPAGSPSRRYSPATAPSWQLPRVHGE